MNTENSITKVLGGVAGNNRRPTWSNIAVVVLFVAAVSGWFMMAGGYREKVNYLEAEIVMVRQRLQEVEKWQRDWPSKGELSLDVGQNTKIEELLRRIGELERRALKVEIVE